ncbi:MAG: VOC family protein [Deltaproteobacteria bacterium]|nr:VOC family protein [Deltaproteobacteria bacterium]
MPVRFDHLLVAAIDKHRSAQFFADMFGLSAPTEAGFFVSVTLSDDAVVHFVQVPPGAEILGQHMAFLVDDECFDNLITRLKSRGTRYWADPRMTLPYQTNTNHGGRGVYFDDPDGHHLEALTRRESSAQL